MTPFDLIGRPYRLGGDFTKHEAGDCLSLARFVLSYYGISTPEPQRDWYRRLRRGDTSVFKEELEKWGEETTQLDYGVVALCGAENGYGMAVYFEHGWLSFQGFGGSVVMWSHTDHLQACGYYCQRKSNFAKR